MKSIRKTAVALSALSLGIALAHPAAAQVGDSKADPRSYVQGVTDNPNTSDNPVGFPHSTNAAHCAGIEVQDVAYANCMHNLPMANAGGARSGQGMFARWRDRGASVGAGERSIDRRPDHSWQGAPGVTDNPNTSANPNTGGDGYRGGDSGIEPQGGY
jgi:hypothetical protein